MQERTANCTTHRSHFLFIVRHGERADQKETRLAFRASDLPQHDPPLRSAFCEFQVSKNVGSGSFQQNSLAVLSSFSLENTKNDSALNKSSAIISQYLQSRENIEEKVFGCQQLQGGVQKACKVHSSEYPERILAITSPLQRCVATLAHIVDKVNPYTTCTDCQLSNSRGEIGQRKLVCDARLYEYLSPGLFTFSSDSKSIVPSQCPTPYVYTQKIPISKNDGEVNREVPANDLKQPFADRCLYVDPTSMMKRTDETDTDKQTSACHALDFSELIANNALKYIEERFPETKQQAEKRFEDFIESYLSNLTMSLKAHQLNPDAQKTELSSPHTQSTKAESNCPSATILCSHKFGVNAMLNHLLRSKTNQEVPTNSLMSTDEAPPTMHHRAKLDWRKLTSDVWIPFMKEALSLRPSTCIAPALVPQFTTRIDAGSVSLVVISWNPSDSSPVCTPVTVGEI